MIKNIFVHIFNICKLTEKYPLATLVWNFRATAARKVIVKVNDEYLNVGKWVTFTPLNLNFEGKTFTLVYFRVKLWNVSVSAFLHTIVLLREDWIDTIPHCKPVATLFAIHLTDTLLQQVIAGFLKFALRNLGSLTIIA